MFNWYKIFNLDDFNALNLVSQDLDLFLTGPGEVTITITKGNEVSINFLDAFLPVNFNGKNPFIAGDYAIYQDLAKNVWLGIVIPT